MAECAKARRAQAARRRARRRTPTRPTPSRRSSTSARSTARSSASSSRPPSRASSGTTRPTTTARAPATWDDGHGDRPGSRRLALVRRPRVRRRLRLARHRLDRGHRPSPVRSRGLRRVGRRHDEVDVTRDQVGVRDLRRGPRQHRSAVPTTVNSTNFGDGGNPLFTDPPGCLFHHQASFITDFFKEQGGAAGRRLRLLPHARHQPRRTPAPSTGAGDLFGMFNDKAAAKRPAEVPRHRRGAADLGRRGAASCRPTRRSPPIPDDVGQRSADASPTPRSSASTAAT